MAWSADSPPGAQRAAAPGPAECGIAALTRRMAAGEEAAWREFHDAYCDRLRLYLLVVTRGNEESAREALQAALLRAVRHVRRFDTEEAFWGWLTVLARSAAMDQQRKHRRYLAFLDRYLAWNHRHEPAAPVDADQRLAEALARALQALPDEERGLVERKYFAGVSVHELAAATGETDKAIESRLGRIRRKLKAAILEELKHES
ncbi:MAG: sigma-70 family RNA polymerase sigma factor [Verrucomicrobia bacterium]|nr:sigma-70 family RNA polymerase sigma factor [Verrucomicrobiota bacterium]